MTTQATVPVERLWGDRVKARREALRFTQRTLAELAETSQGAIWKIEHGLLAPRDDLKARIAAALGTRIGLLFPHADEVAA